MKIVQMYRMKARVVAERGGFHRMFGAALLMLAAIFFLASCGGEEAQQGGGEDPGEDPESAGQEIGVSVADILDDPSEFLGNRVTVSGLVADPVGPNSFAIGGNEFVGDEDLLVVGAQELPRIIEGDVTEIQSGDLVQVTGTLREFDVAEAEEEVGYDLDDARFEDYVGVPVVIANSVVVTPRQGDSNAQVQQEVPVQLTTIIDDPSEFFGERITVSGAVVQVLDPRTSLIVPEDRAEQLGGAFDDPEALADEGVLVVNTAGAGPNLSPLQTVQVTGTLRPSFGVDELEEEFGLDFSEDDEASSAFEGRPAIAATSIQPQAGGTQETTTGR